MEQTELAQDPIAQFQKWWSDSLASDKSEFPDAAALATVGAGGRPSVRMVLVKEIKNGAFYFFTNYESRKALELAANPFAALCFYWNLHGRQVRVEGKVTRAKPEESAAYFASRPRGSQLGAWASPQSREIPGRASLEEKVRELEKKFPAGSSISPPPFWGGFALKPDRLEFWLQGKNRLHDRFEYQWENNGWRIRRLAP